MKTILYLVLLVAAAGYYGSEAQSNQRTTNAQHGLTDDDYEGRTTDDNGGWTDDDYVTDDYDGRTTHDYDGWTDDDYEGRTTHDYDNGNEGWVSCGCHDAPSCRQCGSQPHLCNGDCTWNWSGCHRKDGPGPSRPPPRPTGETPVSMGTRPPPTWETPVYIGSTGESRPPPSGGPRPPPSRPSRPPPSGGSRPPPTGESRPPPSRPSRPPPSGGSRPPPTGESRPPPTGPDGTTAEGATSASSSVPTTGSSSSLDYCSISPEHTMCKYSGPSDECKASTVKRELTDTEKQAILDKHNELRRKVAKGLETRGKPGPQPAASDMLLMVWDDELAAIAQRWADQCTFGHDAKRDTKDGYVGQNAAISSSSAEMTDVAIAASYASATTSWYEEVNDPGFNKDSVSPFVFSSGIGHYTQVVWGSSRAVGCGSVYYNSGSGSFPYNQLIICNYFTGGNLQGAAMYSLGDACSACPSGYPTCTDGLCTV